MLGASVGGLIFVTNARTIFEAYDVAGAVRSPVYLALTAIWLGAAALVVRHARRRGEPLLAR